MTCSVDFQNAYSDLYSLMRNYIWDLDVVEVLADVEVDTFDAFIDLEKLNKDFQRLYPSIKAVADDNDDEEMLEAADAFFDMIKDGIENETPAVYALYRVQETAIDEDGKEIIPQ